MGKINLAIIAPNADAFSETFIRSHVDQINANVSFFHDFDCGFPTKVSSRNFKSEPLNSILKLYGLITGRKVFNLEILFRKELKRRKIKVVLVEYGPTGIEILKILKKLKIPLITHFHGYDAYQNDVLSKYQYRYLDLFDYSFRVIAVSEDMKRQIISIGAPANKIIVNACGPNEEFYGIVPRFSEKSFVFIGRLVDKKAPYYLLFSMQQVVKKHPDAILYIGGDGPLKDACFRITSALGIKNNVKFLGVVSKNDIQQLFRKCRGYVQHSITTLNNDHEGTPVAISEALAARLPVISTKHGGIKDIVVDGVNGYLVDEGDWKSFSNKMLYLLENPFIVKAERLKRSNHIKVLDEIINEATSKPDA